MLGGAAISWRKPGSHRLDTVFRRHVGISTFGATMAGGEMVSQGSLEPLFQVRILARQPYGPRYMMQFPLDNSPNPPSYMRSARPLLTALADARA